MERLIKGMLSIKTELALGVGALGGYFSAMFGGWDMPLDTLALLMIIDYCTGLALAGIFHKSPKTKSGKIESNAGFKGLCRKGMVLLLVLISYRLDLVVGSSLIRNAVIYGFIVNELISIAENAGRMGLVIPTAFKKGIAILNEKE